MSPGQFWAVPLRGGRFAAGRVLQLSEKDGRRDRRMFLAGLLRWIGDRAPTSDAIAGAPLIASGQAHIATIQRTGGQILGLRQLEDDGLLIPTFVDARVPWFVLKGLTPIRRALPNDASRYPTLTTWGRNFITLLAEEHLI
jgi:hypothetical protein